MDIELSPLVPLVKSEGENIFGTSSRKKKRTKMLIPSNSFVPLLECQKKKILIAKDTKPVSGNEGHEIAGNDKCENDGVKLRYKEVHLTFQVRQRVGSGRFHGLICSDLSVVKVRGRSQCFTQRFEVHLRQSLLRPLAKVIAAKE